MSQNKTIIPESEYDLEHPAYSDINSCSDFYRPSGAIANSTVIAGEGNNAQQSIPLTATSNVRTGTDDNRSRTLTLQERVIIGVMFSISKGLLGEIFPLYLGRNMIGSAPSCDIYLKEKSVSEEHAVLFARCDSYPGDCNLSVTDYGSYYGTSVNQEEVRYQTLKISDGDVLTIGNHYRLIVRLFDIEKTGLFEDSDFEDSSSSTADAGNESVHDFYRPSNSPVGNDNRTVIG